MTSVESSIARQPAKPRRKSGSRSTIKTRITSLIDIPFDTGEVLASTSPLR
jgi:hypothetical protein